MSFMAASLGQISFLKRSGTQGPEIYVIVLGAVTFVVLFFYSLIPVFKNMREKKVPIEQTEKPSSIKFLKWLKSPYVQLTLAIMMMVLWIAASVTISTIINIYETELKACYDGKGVDKSSSCKNILISSIISWVIFGLWTILTLIFVRKALKMHKESMYSQMARPQA
ncbi:hypothetical protein BB561_002084 [Smittium simulii]|uniref:Uncharacterized protein n=1 Tax=Smittium simulii TaxID=133385 RepID=A0A2T9YRT6_9FUNG|nr:hypothetical protein BB561_002084 [Smittium simulii]